MFYPILRYLIIALFLVLGVVMHIQLGIGQAWYMYLAAAALLATHLLFGSVWQAFSLLRRGQPARAAALLRHTWAPGLLLRRNRAYYFFVKGLMLLQEKELEAGAAELERAVAIGLQRSNDNALAYLNLAHIAFVQKDYARSRKALESARAFQPKDLMIKDKLKELESALAQN
ncbi:MAG: hypothetical protein H6564_05415 [Lewinellaceae bacterium]|nr:hypothetical protein [Lewinellaceae bacterium]